MMLACSMRSTAARSAWLLTALLPSIVAQFIKPPTDLINATGYAGIPVRYKQVPTGICELNPNVKSFSGYADVDKDQHIFFWFFEARNQDPTEAPLTVWINGGPGSSSMIGLFQELGPCFVDINGNPYNNPYSWSEASNMLFIDQPTQVGFSYSIPVPGSKSSTASSSFTVLPNDTCPPTAAQCGTFSKPDLSLTANSTAAAAPNFWKTLQGFMGAFPQYSRSSFHFTTESYGGHYGPVFNEYIEQQNAKNIPGAKNINLQSVLIGNGWYDPLIQYAAYYNFTVSPGNTYDLDIYTPEQAAEVYASMYGAGNCTDQLKQCKATGDNDICSNADNFCYQYVENPFDDVSNRDEYDSRELSPDPFPYNFYVDYLNTPKVQQAIGAYVNYSDSNDAVGTDFGLTGDDGREDNTIEDVQALLKDGIVVAMYAGDADYNCNWLGGQVVAEEVAGNGFQFGWSAAGFQNITTSDGIVHGQVRQSGKFSFSRIYLSGHEVPFYQPLTALSLFERVITGRDVATGMSIVGKCYRTSGPKKSTYREGNSTVQYELVPVNITYDTSTGAPGAPWPSTPGRRRG